MEVQLTAEQETLLSQVASHEGKPVGQLLTECATHLLCDKELFLAEVEEGLAAAERGEFIEEDETDLRVEAMLKARGSFVGRRWRPTIWKVSRTIST